jgi:hypothetical protein
MNVPCTYMLRRRHMVIVPKGYVKQAPEKIDVALEARMEGMSLADALDQLSTDTGVSIVLDPRVEDKARQTTIRSSIRNVRLLSAVRMLANMADLSVMNIDGALYVTEPTNVSKLQSELDGNPLTEPGKAVPTGGSPPTKSATPAGGAATKPAPEKGRPSGKSSNKV